MSDIVVALAIVFVIEGFLPFLAPRVWREAMRRVSEMTDGQLRFIGLGSMLAGLAILALTR